MAVLLAALQMLFALMAAMLLLAGLQSRHLGLLLGALTYGASAWYSLELAAWWPLALGFVCAWGLRAVGADPGSD